MRTNVRVGQALGLRAITNLLIGKAHNCARFTSDGPELLNYAELGRLVV